MRLIGSERLLACERHADRALEAVLVLANPTSEAVTERVRVADAMPMDDTPLVDLLDAPDSAPALTIGSGFVTAPCRRARCACWLRRSATWAATAATRA